MMWPRLELLRDFPTEDGSIWVSLDDSEAHYFKIVGDELFGRRNFIVDVAWQKRDGPPNDRKIGMVHEHVLIWAKSKAHAATAAPRINDPEGTPPTTATVERLERHGVRLLAIPGSYYDDSRPRPDLPADQIETMRAHSDLYDRKGGAEYFRVYTEAVDQRFFFEIVQRCGYRSHGAGNAPVWLVAQARLSAGAP